MTDTVIALIAAAVCAVVVLLVAEAKGRRPLVLAAKPLASACFVAVGWASLRAAGPYGAWIMLGLVLSMAGDILLMFRRAFLAGIGVFLAAHIAYLAAFHVLLPAHDWPLWIAAPVTTTSAFAAAWLWPHLGRLRAPVAAYVAAITLMLWGALAVMEAGRLAGVFAAGAALFYLSDLAVARDRFVQAGFVNRACGLPAYYLGQILLALSVGG
jgi:uncharacterized membrane protein YhhN